MDCEAIKTEALAWPDQARALTVTNTATYTKAASLLLGIKALRRTIEETFGPHCQRAFQAHRALVAEQKQAEAPLAEAERIIKDAMRVYDVAQERVRVAEQRRLEALARDAAEARRLAEAMAAEEDGDTETANQILDEAPADVVVQMASQTPIVAGIAYRVTWAATVTDLGALVRHVATHPEHLGLLSANGPALNALARALKGTLTIPGVQAVSTRDIAAGR